jgi:O-antigen/teichoic acid export membrane protein
MLFYGPGTYKDRFVQYLGVVLRGHWRFAVTISVLMGALGLWFRLRDWALLSEALGWLGLAGPFILFFWLVRRACYVRLAPQLAASGAAGYLLLVLAGLYTLSCFDAISPGRVFGLMAVASFIGGSWLVYRLRGQSRGNGREELAVEVTRDHWKYGRWGMVSTVLSWVPENSSYLFLPMWDGIEAAAVLRALMNLTVPALQAHSALGSLLLPFLVKDHGRLRRNIRVALGVFAVASAGYWLALGLVYREAVTWLYAGRYTSAASLVWILGAVPIPAGIAVVLAGGLRAMNRPDLVARSYVISSVASLVLGFELLATWGVSGAAWLMLVASSSTAACLGFMYQRASASLDTESSTDDRMPA